MERILRRRELARKRYQEANERENKKLVEAALYHTDNPDLSELSFYLLGSENYKRLDWRTKKMLSEEILRKNVENTAE